MNGKIIIHHQGYVTLTVPEGQNRIHLTQDKTLSSPTVITVVGRQNLDALIAALQDVRESLS